MPEYPDVELYLHALRPRVVDRVVDRLGVLGPNVLRTFAPRPTASEGRRVLDTDFLDLETYPFVTELDPQASRRVGAFVTIQKGCDNKCTFCIVPSTRGAEASRPAGLACRPSGGGNSRTAAETAARRAARPARSFPR